MARSRAKAHAADSDEREIIAWYEDLLANTGPPTGLRYPPVAYGPTWQWRRGRWVLPKVTLGWGVLAWCGLWLRDNRSGQPWQFTAEQARFLLWFYALDERARFRYHTAVLQRLKGWGKDPVAACVSAVSMFGPVSFDHWVGDRPVGRDEPDAWVQVVAVSQEQTKNTMKLFPGLIPPETRRKYGIQIGKLNVWGLKDTRQTEAVTASVDAIEGGRPTLVVPTETQNWKSSNAGHDMAEAIEGNAAKSPGAAARMLHLCNSYRPDEDSVAQRNREAWEATQGKHATTIDFGLMYDSLEAPPKAPLTAKEAPEVIRGVQGDSHWHDIDRVVNSIVNPANPASESRRKWYNQTAVPEDAWCDPKQWDAMHDRTLVLADGDMIALGFDGSTSDDHSALIGTRIEDGAWFTLGVWDPEQHGGEAPRDLIDGTVRQVCERYDVVAFFADLHPFESYVDAWAEDKDIGGRLCAKASGRHAIAWDMRSRVKQFTLEGAVRTETEITEQAFRHDGDKQCRRHVHNARRRPNQWGIGFGKEHRESARKIDSLPAGILSRMARRAYLALPESKQRRRKRTGEAVFV